MVGPILISQVDRNLLTQGSYQNKAKGKSPKKIFKIEIKYEFQGHSTHPKKERERERETEFHKQRW